MWAVIGGWLKLRLDPDCFQIAQLVIIKLRVSGNIGNPWVCVIYFSLLFCVFSGLWTADSHLMLQGIRASVARYELFLCFCRVVNVDAYPGWSLRCSFYLHICWCVQAMLTADFQSNVGHTTVHAIHFLFSFSAQFKARSHTNAMFAGVPLLRSPRWQIIKKSFMKVCSLFRPRFDNL